MTPAAFNTELRDGSPVLVRPVERSDGQLLEMGLDHLSKQSRYFRFFAPVEQLTQKRLDYFATVDQVDHIAVGAIDLAHEEVYPIGVSRCFRLKSEPDEAEVAVTVIDSHQGKGLGTILLAAVAHAATAGDITTFVASVLADNHAMLNLFRELDATSHFEERGVVGMRIPLHNDPARYPQTPAGDVFRQIATLQAGSP